MELSEPIILDRNKKHSVEILVTGSCPGGLEKRLADSMETAMKLSDGLVIVAVPDGEDTLFTANYACSHCGVSIEELTPRMFSFNSPYGACPTCTGLARC
jgi:excinuclease ABC subunit A